MQQEFWTLHFLYDDKICIYHLVGFNLSTLGSVVALSDFEPNKNLWIKISGPLSVMRRVSSEEKHFEEKWALMPDYSEAAGFEDGLLWGEVIHIDVTT
jgi:hypothetical protein